MRTSVLELLHLSDAALAAKAATNDDAIEALMHRHGRGVKKYLHTLLRDADDEDDAFQDLQEYVLTAFRKQRYIENGLFRKWINTVAFHIAILIKKRNKRQCRFIDCDEELTKTDEPLPLSDALKKIPDCEELLKKLPLSRRIVMRMRAIEQISFKEIAAKLGIKVGAATSIYYKAKMQLRKLLSARKIGSA